MITRRHRRLGIVVALATAAGGLAGTAPAESSTAQPLPTIRYAETPKAVPDSFIVVLKPGQNVAQVRDSLLAQYGGSAGYTYTSAIQGFSMTTSAANAGRLATDAKVAYVAQNQEVTLDALGVQNNPPSYGIDRIDQRSLPLDAKYHYPNTASSVWAFVIDTGIRLTHQEFITGGVSRAFCGFDPWAEGCAPCNQFHGTHVAGTIGGNTVGVAKGVKIVSVRVFRCSSGTSWDIVIAGVDYVTFAAQINPGVRMVANMSLGGAGFQPVDDAVTASINANVHYSVSAGNSGVDVCTFNWGNGVTGFSPARTPRATTVAATDATDTRPAFSNTGSCVDVFAPGVAVYSAMATSDSAYGTASGTSMSSPHAAGTAAMWRQKFPADNVDAVHNAINGNATPGVVVNPGLGSPNRMLYMGMIPV
jgi:subtilisin family serine protease